MSAANGSGDPRAELARLAVERPSLQLDPQRDAEAFAAALKWLRAELPPRPSTYAVLCISVYRLARLAGRRTGQIILSRVMAAALIAEGYLVEDVGEGSRVVSMREDPVAALERKCIEDWRRAKW